MLQSQGVKKAKNEVDQVALAIMEKIKEMTEGPNTECMFQPTFHIPSFLSFTHPLSLFHSLYSKLFLVNLPSAPIIPPLSLELKEISTHGPFSIIAIILEGSNKPAYTVKLTSEDPTLSELRKQIESQCDITFDYKFINHGTEYASFVLCLFFFFSFFLIRSPLSSKQEEIWKLNMILDEKKQRITIMKK